MLNKIFDLHLDLRFTFGKIYMFKMKIIKLLSAVIASTTKETREVSLRKTSKIN